MGESAKSRGLRSNVGYVGAWVTWVKFLLGLRGLRGSKYFLCGLPGSNIFLRGLNFFEWVFAWVKIFYVVPNFLRGSKFFMFWSTFA